MSTVQLASVIWAGVRSGCRLIISQEVNNPNVFYYNLTDQVTELSDRVTFAENCDWSPEKRVEAILALIDTAYMNAMMIAKEEVINRGYQLQ